MNKWTFRGISWHFLVKNRKISYFTTLLVMIFLLAAYLQQNVIQEYSRYNWLQGNRELLSLHNTATYYKPNASPFTPAINELTESESKVISNSCIPKYNIVFLKTHKCASTTIQNIFMRNGFMNNKVFVLPAKANYLGHPMPFNRDLVPNPKLFNHEYNILTHHSRLNYESMRSIMPNDTLFITIVRDPVDLFESMFHYYRLDKFWNISFNIFGDENIKIPNKIYRNRYLGKIGINQMMFDLGMNISDFTKPYTVREYIDKLDTIFDLVMLSERMDESLILLKHLLCWTTDDVIAFKLNARHLNAKSNLTQIASSRIKGLNWADHQLYKHFSRKFSLIVKAFGSQKMSQEVIELKNRTNEWYDYCVGDTDLPYNAKKSMIVRLINKQRDNSTCWLLTAQEMDFTKFLRMRQIKTFPGSVYLAPSIPPKHKYTSKEELRQQYIKSKLLLFDPKYKSKQIICKKCLYELETTRTTTIDPSYQLEIALRDVHNKQ